MEEEKNKKTKQINIKQNSQALCNPHLNLEWAKKIFKKIK